MPIEMKQFVSARPKECPAAIFIFCPGHFKSFGIRSHLRLAAMWCLSLFYFTLAATVCLWLPQKKKPRASFTDIPL